MQDALEYLIKWKGVSYMHVEWVTANLMREYRQWGVGRMQRMVNSEEGQVRHTHTLARSMALNCELWRECTQSVGLCVAIGWGRESLTCVAQCA
jgi:hypothetical protein